MTDILMNEVSGDISIIKGGLSLIENPVDALRQRLLIRLRTFQEEWFLNQNAGLPYFQSIFKKGISKDLVDSIFRGFLLRTPSVERVVEFTSSLDPRERTYTLSFKVFTDSGETLTITNFEV